MPADADILNLNISRRQYDLLTQAADYRRDQLVKDGSTPVTADKITA